MISVIVPVYNTAPYLRRCLDSICAQTYTDLEIICVNDGSTDYSAEILSEYECKDKRITVIHRPHAGLSAARNTALNIARGEWITGVDSDDYIAADLYERAIIFAQNTVDMVFFGVQMVDETGANLPLDESLALPPANLYEMTPDIAEKLNVCFCTKLWRRHLIEKANLRFPEGLIHEDDAMYHLAIPYVHHITVCPVTGYYYVQRPCSIMHNSQNMNGYQRMTRCLPVLEYVYEEYTKRNLLQFPQKAYLIKLFVRNCAWHHGDEAVCKLLKPIICKTGIHKYDYRLECLLPVRGLLRFFISKNPRSKVYRFMGVAIWIVLYTNSGKIAGYTCPIWCKLKNFFAH